MVFTLTIYSSLSISFISYYHLQCLLLLILPQVESNDSVLVYRFVIIIIMCQMCEIEANVVDPFVKERGFPTPIMKMVDFRDKYQEMLVNNSLMWCKYCEWYVSKSSKHCRACNRCTSHFDHHCRWLNNCVSKQNYTSFFISICSTETLLLYEITLGILIITNKIDASNHLFIHFQSLTFIYTLIALQTFIAVFMAIPLAQLIAFHIYLYKKDMTTYDWVVSNEKKLKQKQNEKQAQNKYANDKREKDKGEEDQCQSHSISMIENTLTRDDDEEKQSNQNIKAKIISKSGNNIKKGFRKYFYSLRDCEYKFHRKNVSRSHKMPTVDKQVMLILFFSFFSDGLSFCFFKLNRDWIWMLILMLNCLD